jgi:hypothetical protein
MAGTVECKIGAVNIFSESIRLLRSLKTEYEPHGSHTLLTMMSDITDIARDIGETASDASREVLVDAIRIKLNSIVVALMRGSEVFPDEKSEEIK